MSKPVTCSMCGGEVDDADTVEMPNGRMCLDPCYKWLENMMEESEDDDDDDMEGIVIVFDPDEDLFWDEEDE